MTPADLHAAILAGGVADVEALQAAIAALTPEERYAQLVAELRVAEEQLPALWAAVEQAFPIPTPHTGFALLMASARFACIPGATLAKSAWLTLAAMVYDGTVAGQAADAAEQASGAQGAGRKESA